MFSRREKYFAAIQVIEEPGPQRRGKVIDAATGLKWVQPDSGFIAVTFKVSRELPSKRVREAARGCRYTAIPGPITRNGIGGWGDTSRNGAAKKQHPTL